jgi:hopanoid biosynthesis associated protein HpnK
MARPENVRRLIVNADDFGRSKSINEAVILAHRQGILTTASLMVNEPECDVAVSLAKQNPKLGVGLHLSLLCGVSGLSPEKIPGLVDKNGCFSDQPTSVGFRYFSRSNLRGQLRAEIHEQFRRFRATGLVMDHVNGHLHMHLHPTVFQILMNDAEELGIERLRLTRDPFRLNAKLAAGRWLYRSTHAFIYRCLSGRAGPHLKRKNIRHTNKVFGLLQNALVDEAYVTKLLPLLPAGDSELYSHPSLDEFRNEYEALVSPAVKNLVAQLGIDLIRYQDL